MLAFSVIPLFLFVTVCELLLRWTIALPPLVPFSPEVYEDRNLFWRVKPNLDTTCIRGGHSLKTNNFGFRNSPISPKSINEKRILSMGESTTYGDYVQIHETYSHIVEQALNRSQSTNQYRLINTGAPSYTSFQSFRLLNELVDQLQPDAVLLYHEGNDYLPSGWGSSTGRAETDPERWNRLNQTPFFWWLGRLRIYRTPASWFRSPPHNQQTLNSAYNYFGNRIPSLPTRLTAEQQTHVLHQFKNLCVKKNIQLLLIHPTYLRTIPHQCPLTRFANQNHIPLFETYPLFAIATEKINSRLFVDPAHPTAEGHQRIGKALVPFILQHFQPTTP